jgi:hypothetical protein
MTAGSRSRLWAAGNTNNPTGTLALENWAVLLKNIVVFIERVLCVVCLRIRT